MSNYKELKMPELRAFAAKHGIKGVSKKSIYDQLAKVKVIKTVNNKRKNSSKKPVAKSTSSEKNAKHEDHQLFTFSQYPRGSLRTKLNLSTYTNQIIQKGPKSIVAGNVFFFPKIGQEKNFPYSNYSLVLWDNNTKEEKEIYDKYKALKHIDFKTYSKSTMGEKGSLPI
jgi:hypothetical protein